MIVRIKLFNESGGSTTPYASQNEIVLLSIVIAGKWSLGYLVSGKSYGVIEIKTL